ncbi:MAG: nitroreductase/quinone reductase family protein [Acidimicrobiales bacterium]
MVAGDTKAPKVPPAWFERLFWRCHRLLHRMSGGRFLWKPGGRMGWGAMGVTTIGRRSGRRRTVIVGYLLDGDRPVTMAMNGWQEGHPAWWRNAQAHPDVEVKLPGRARRPMRAVAASGAERERLWRRWAEVDDDLDGYAALRQVETPVVIFEPR